MAQTGAIAEAPFTWQESLQEALEQAERESKLVLLDFYSPT
jgi:hypothetical protein